MQVRRFELEMERPGGSPSGSRPEPASREVVRAAPEPEPDDQRIRDTIEEPGYGHGV